MARIWYLYIIIFFVISCSSNHKQIEEVNNTAANESKTRDTFAISISTIASNIMNIDSLMVIKANDSELFKIALGGNVELLSDTVLKVGYEDIGIMTLADYFQNDQIFYIVYDPKNSSTYQSEKLYLPYIGMGIQDYNLLDSITISDDILLVTSHTCLGISTILQLDTLQCDVNGIINFYEFK